jgi:adenine-specific DNA-methyltransferase
MALISAVSVKQLTGKAAVVSATSLSPLAAGTGQVWQLGDRKDYNPAMLAEAMCKHMGFTYAPAEDPQEYWRHGHSTETDFIYVTTQALTHDACAKIAHDVGPDRSLLICCKAFDTKADAFDNLTLVKIPTSILQKCEWGRDDYSLNIQNLPIAEDDADSVEDEAPRKAKRSSKAKPDAMDLFGGEAGDE